MTDKALSERLAAFEEKIGYSFKNKNLLHEALSHSSYANECKKGRNSNERLEFLGDSVLSIVISEHLFNHFKHLPEGDLTKIRASLVCEKALFEFSKQISLGEFILLGKGEENTGGRNRPSIVSDAFEAVIAAVFLDGGMEAAREYVLGFIPKDLDKNSAKKLQDYKTILQEIIQRNPEEKVEYVLRSQSGPDHDRHFVVEVCLNTNVIGHGEGHSKKQAEQQAAKEALRLMGCEV
ncbi:MAG: ribonuclease III [Oscillospiraceae bacterium]|uniref:ribonuclease III n=1 Tax=Huintestinicola sp. TaxID=2981661 RepID=UPI002A948404|nr:ribonuclease III [Oscillospiraceae bacterium]MDY6207601.1 ribonuclease III [Oscillospiraceae bacterium]